MSWITLTTNEILSEMAPLEVAALQGIQGSDNLLAALLDKAVAEARGAIRAGEYRVGPEGTIPSQIAADVVAIARWRWLISFPQLTRLQTKERKDAFTGARETLKDIARQKLKIEPPTVEHEGHGPEHQRPQPASGQWNSENKLLNRTHPVPTPQAQWPVPEGTMPPWANPEMPE